jgi:hypothetical protein
MDDLIKSFQEELSVLKHKSIVLSIEFKDKEPTQEMKTELGNLLAQIEIIEIKLADLMREFLRKYAEGSEED